MIGGGGNCEKKNLGDPSTGRNVEGILGENRSLLHIIMTCELTQLLSLD